MSLDLRLDGKVAVVTGGASGIDDFTLFKLIVESGIGHL